MFEIWLGTFDKEDFIWKTLKEFDKFDDAYKYFKDFSVKALELDVATFEKEYGSGRLDIELRQGEKRIDWVGIFLSERE